MTRRHPLAPTTLGARVITHLQQHGGALRSPEIATIFSCDPTSVSTKLRGCINHGELVLLRGDGGKVRYALPGDAAQDATATPAPRKTSRRGAAGRAAAASRRAAPVVAEPVDPPPPPGPVASLWDDGDIVLHGLEPNTDGASATIGEDHARRLYRFLHRLFGPPELSSYPVHAPAGPMLTHDGARR